MRTETAIHATECERHGGYVVMACPSCLSLRSTDIGRDIASAARSLIGTRFVFNGRSNSGIDCLGVAALAWKRGAGIDRDFTAAHSSRIEGIDVEAECRSRAPCRDDLESAQIGDVILFRLNGMLRHFGVLTEKGTVVAANREIGMVIESMLDERWARRAVLRISPRWSN